MWPIWYSPALIASIDALVAADLVEVRWLTTWCDDAPRYLAPRIGMQSVCDVVRREPCDIYSWWKFDAVLKVMDEEGHRPLIWTDDHLRDQRRAIAWVSHHLEHSLVISPSPHIGLTPGDIDQITSFCQEHARRAA